MTRITVSLPDDVGRYLAEKPNASAEVAAAVRQRMKAETLQVAVRDILEAAGFNLTEAGLAHYRQKLKAARAAQAALTDADRAAHEQERRAWLAAHPGLAQLNASPAA